MVTGYFCFANFEWASDATCVFARLSIDHVDEPCVTRFATVSIAR